MRGFDAEISPPQRADCTLVLFESFKKCGKQLVLHEISHRPTELRNLPSVSSIKAVFYRLSETRSTEYTESGRYRYNLPQATGCRASETTFPPGRPCTGLCVPQCASQLLHILCSESIGRILQGPDKALSWAPDLPACGNFTW